MLLAAAFRANLTDCKLAIITHRDPDKFVRSPRETRYYLFGFGTQCAREMPKAARLVWLDY